MRAAGIDQGAAETVSSPVEVIWGDCVQQNFYAAGALPYPQILS